MKRISTGNYYSQADLEIQFKNKVQSRKKSEAMRPLETNQLLLTWLYAFPPDESSIKWKRIVHFVFSSGVLIAHFLSVMAGGTFIFKFVSIDLEEAIFALFHTIAACNMFYQSIVIVLLRHKFTAIFKDLSTIYDKSKN